MKSILWHNLSEPKIFNILKSSEYGLTEEEAHIRLKQFGFNKLPERRAVGAWDVFINQITSPLVYILFFAALMAIFLKNWLDLVIIMFVVLTNTAIGFFQEYKANESIAYLRKMIRYKAMVLRDSHIQEIDAENIVVGDVVALEEGLRVPADARIIQENDLEVNEATLTGESTPSKKTVEILDLGTVLADRENMVYMGTVVTRGRGLALVCETGERSQFGLIAKLITETKEEKTPLQIKLGQLTNSLTFVVLAISLIVVFIGIATNKPLLHSENGHEEGILYTGIALAVAAIPEGLLVAITVILAVGMRRVLKEKALIRRLIAAETLGSTSVICTDKTGTLTEGKMMVTKISLPEAEFSFDEVLQERWRQKFSKIIKISSLCNNANIENYEKDPSEWVSIGNATETALLISAARFGSIKYILEKEYKRIDEIPFSSEKKFMATLHLLQNNENIIYAKGSPESILARSSFYEKEDKKLAMDAPTKSFFNHQYEMLSRKGLRVLAFAYKKSAPPFFLQQDIDDLVFVGFIGIKDPLRKDAKHTFENTKKAGIRTVIVTGDHKYTAQSIAKEMGLSVKDENILEGADLDKMSDDELYKKVKHIDIFSRVNPHHKLRIIDAWQKRGEVVAMTGDGVNDAPALKSADIGIALNSGTDVAKENADIVLLDNNFKTILSAIEQGRIIFDNIRKVVLYLLSDSFAQITLITASLIMGLPLPLIPLQILWINLVADGLPALAFTMEIGEKDIVFEKPRKRNEPVLNLQIKLLILFISVGINIPFFIVYYLLLSKGYGYSLEHIRTIIFTSFSISTLLYSFSCRSLRHLIFQKNIFSNKFLNASVMLGIAFQLLAIYEPHLQDALRTVPLNIYDWSIVIIFSAFSIIIIESTKFAFIESEKIKLSKNSIKM